MKTMLLAVSAVLALIFSPVAGAAVVLMVGPTQFIGVSPPIPPGQTTAWQMPQQLSGSMCASNTCVAVNYPATNGFFSGFGKPSYSASVAIGVANLQKAIAAQPPGTQIVVFGYSQGAAVAASWITQNSSLPGAPSPSTLSFVLIGDPGSPTGMAALTPTINKLLFSGTDIVTPTNSQYQIVNVVLQQDGFANLPAKLTPGNVLTDIAGMLTVHSAYKSVNLFSPANIVTQQGNTTYIYVPHPSPLGKGYTNPLPGTPLTSTQTAAVLASINAKPPVAAPAVVAPKTAAVSVVSPVVAQTPKHAVALTKPVASTKPLAATPKAAQPQHAGAHVGRHKG